MAIDLFWDNENQDVLLAEFKGDWTWDELYRVLKTIKRLSDEKQRKLGAIVDVREGLKLPNGSVFNREGLNNFRKILSIDSGQGKGPVVVLGMSPAIKSLLNTIRTFDRSQTNDVFFADTMEDARKVIYAEVAKLEASA